MNAVVLALLDAELTLELKGRTIVVAPAAQLTQGLEALLRANMAPVAEAIRHADAATAEALRRAARREPA